MAADCTISRRDALKALGGLALAATLGQTGAFAQEPPKAAERPNILFIMTDDHAAHSLGCYGSPYYKTPNLDRIAQGGVRFANAFVTNALCSPSRAVLLTGKYSHLNGIRENNLTNPAVPGGLGFDGRQQTFPKLLQAAGYKTALLGKWHLKTDPTGFDYWNIIIDQGEYIDPPMIEMGETKPHKGYVVDIVTDMTIKTIDQFRAADQPFCVMCHHKAPHRSWVSDKKYAELYKDTVFPHPPTFDDDYQRRASAAGHADMRLADIPDWKELIPKGLSPAERKEWNFQNYMREYGRVIASLDDNIGRLLDHLDKTGLAQNTVVVYTSDNGMFLGDHGWFDKRFMYEESLRVPLMIRYPKETRPGRVEERMALNLDLAETFLDYAGAPVPADMQGRSLRPLLAGKAPADWRKSVYYHYYEYPEAHRAREHYGVRTERYKLIHFYTIGEWELFDLEKDPRELNNVYADPAYAAVRKELKAELKRLRTHYQDTDGARPGGAGGK